MKAGAIIAILLVLAIVGVLAWAYFSPCTFCKKNEEDGSNLWYNFLCFQDDEWSAADANCDWATTTTPADPSAPADPSDPADPADPAAPADPAPADPVDELITANIVKAGNNNKYFWVNKSICIDNQIMPGINTINNGEFEITEVNPEDNNGDGHCYIALNDNISTSVGDTIEISSQQAMNGSMTDYEFGTIWGIPFYGFSATGLDENVCKNYCKRHPDCDMVNYNEGCKLHSSSYVNNDGNTVDAVFNNDPNYQPSKISRKN